MTDTYDIVIIGSGAGGGTLHARTSPPRASASSCSSEGAGFRASWRTGSPRASSSRTATSRRIPGTTRRGSRSSRRCTTSSAARPSSTAPLSTACGVRTSGAPPSTASRGWPISYDELEPTTRHWPSSSTRCTEPGEDPTEPEASGRPRSGRSRTSRRIQQLWTTWPRPATTVRRAVRHPAGRVDHDVRALRELCDGFPCVLHAVDAEVIGVRPVLEHPITLLDEREGRQAGDERGRPRSGVVVERDGAEERFAGDVSWSRGSLLREVLLESATDKDPERPRQRIRPGGAQLHVRRQPGGPRPLPRGDPDHTTRRRSG